MFKSILLPIDLHQESSWKQAVKVASRIAEEQNAKLHVFTVIPDYGMSLVGSFFPADHEKKSMAEAEKALKAFVTEHCEGDVDAHVRHGTIYKEIISAANSIGCDLIVLASHRPETKDYLLGPNAARVVRHASQSVFVVRD